MINLYKGDCLEVMDSLIEKGIKVDCILTDPPYGMKFCSGHRKEKYDNIKNDDNLEWLDLFVEKIYKLAKDNTAHYCFCSWHYIDKFKQSIERFFEVKDILVWEKNNTGMGDLRGGYAPKCEFIIFFKKGKTNLNGKREPNIFKFSRTNNELHPTQKPVDLLKFLLSKVTNENDTILDCFMGSGSTGCACKELNRDFIGIELDENYFNIAKNRIEKHTFSTELFD